MGTERKRKVSLFDVVDQTSVSAKLGRAGINGAAAANPSINPWNGRPYSARYFEILEKRRTLPVWQQKDDFLRVLSHELPPWRIFTPSLLLSVLGEAWRARAGERVALLAEMRGLGIEELRRWALDVSGVRRPAY
jgi:hypothetical protein